MAKKERIVRHIAEDMRAMAERGEDQTALARAGSVMPQALEASIAADPDEAGLTFDWSQASVKTPQLKAVLNMRVDQDVLDYFRRGGADIRPKSTPSCAPMSSRCGNIDEPCTRRRATDRTRLRNARIPPI